MERNYIHSHSELELHDTCPYLHGELKRTGFKVTTPAMDFGKGFHRIGQNYGLHCKKIGWTCDLEKISSLTQAAIEEFSLDQDQAESIMELAGDFARNVHFPDGCQFELQLRFDENWNPVTDPKKTAWVGGTLDMVFPDQSGNPFIIDWKTDHAIPLENSSFGRRYARQLRRYSAMKMLADGKKWDHCSGADYFVRYDRQSYPVMVQADQVENILSEFREELIRMENDTDPKPRPGTHCHTCPIARICPAKKDLPEGAFIVLDTPEAATDAAQQKFLLTGQIHQLDAALRQYASTRGPIRVSEGQLGFWEETETRYSQTKELIEFLQARGLTLEIIVANLNPTKKLVKSLAYAVCDNNAKKAKALLTELDETFLGPEVTTNFSMKKEEE